MRTIKFRGKRSDNGLWVDGDLVTSLTPKGKMTKYPAINTIYGTIGTFFVQPETVGQFTGLHDRNGKEIYEGDIVNFDDTTYNPYASSYTGEVVSYRGCWCVKNETDYGVFYPNLFRDDFADRKTTLLGNIHDNPELLKKEMK